MAKVRKVLLTIMVVGGTLFAASFSTAGIALADSVGQCNLTPGNTITSPSEELSALSQEGVLQQATSQVYSPAGYTHGNAGDMSVSQWFGKKVVETNSYGGFFGKDYMCHNGVMSVFDEKGYESNTKVFAVLPNGYNKSNSSTHRTKQFTERKVVGVWFIGLGTCANPNLARGRIVIWVKKHKKPAKKKPAPKKPTPTIPTLSCPASYSYVAALASCVQQTNNASQECAGKGGVSSGSGVNFTCTIIQINGNCSNINVYNGNNIQVESHQEGNCNVKIEEPPVVEKCPEGYSGTPPYCVAPKCPEGYKGVPPHCEKPEEKALPIKLSNLRKLEAKDKGEAATPGGTEPITVELSDPAGDSVELIFNDEFGHFQTSTIVVNKSGKYQETLVIPKDVGLEEDTYWVTATDLKTGQETSTENWTYGIKPAKEKESEEEFY
jgi:hypothetical protein